nr:MAG TPA: hypothetical protein [Caudoviricetes sp.]
MEMRKDNDFWMFFIIGWIASMLMLWIFNII